MSRSIWHSDELSTCLPTSDHVSPSKGSRHHMTTWTLSSSVKTLRESTPESNTKYVFFIHKVKNMTNIWLGLRSSMVSCSPSNSSHGTRQSALLDMHSITPSQAGGSASLPSTKPTSCTFPALSNIRYLIFWRKMSDGMFLSACREVSKEFPDVTYDEDLLDRVCLQVCFSSLCTKMYTSTWIRLSPTLDLTRTV